MAAKKKAIKRKPSKALATKLARQTVTEIAALIKTQKKLDLELKKVARRIKVMMEHQYFT